MEAIAVYDLMMGISCLMAREGGIHPQETGKNRRPQAFGEVLLCRTDIRLFSEGINIGLHRLIAF